MILSSCWPLALFAIGCGPAPRPASEPSASVATDPHATDSLARLMRLQLTADNPLDVDQLMICEALAIYERLGPAEGRRRVKGVQDTIYRTREDSIAAERASQKMRGGMTTTDCDSASVAARKHRADSLARKSP